MNYTLITGASGGIGECLAELCARDKNNLILVARRKENLEVVKNRLTEKYGVQVITVEKDLTQENAAEELYAFTEENNLCIDVLINNAGFGDWGAFIDCDVKKQDDMIKLNILTLMHTCKLFGKDMKERGGGKIMNLASVASFCAGPYMSVYYASKAFVLSFSQAIREELLPYGVTVTALCPGPTATDFEKNAGIGNQRLFSAAGSKMKVAKKGYKAMKKGKAICVTGKYATATVVGTRLASRRTCRKVVGKMNKGKTK